MQKRQLKYDVKLRKAINGPPKNYLPFARAPLARSLAQQN